MNILNKEQLDPAKVVSFLQVNDKEREFTSILQSPTLTAFYGAVEAERITGMIVVWKSTFHPDCMYFRILLHNDTNPTLIGNELLATIAYLEKGPFQTSVWETDSLNHFYKEKGFQLIRKTYIPTVEIDTPLLDIYSLEAKSLSKDNLHTLAKVATDSKLKNKLIKTTKKIYEDTHQANPAADLGLAEWENLIFAPDTISELSYIHVNSNQEIVAFGYLHEMNANTVELGWIGLQQNQRPELLIQIVSKQLQRAKQKGYTYITGEFDSTNPYAMLIFQKFSIPPSPCWNTYQKRNL